MLAVELNIKMVLLQQYEDTARGNSIKKSLDYSMPARFPKTGLKLIFRWDEEGAKSRRAGGPRWSQVAQDSFDTHTKLYKIKIVSE